MKNNKYDWHELEDAAESAQAMIKGGDLSPGVEKALRALVKMFSDVIKKGTRSEYFAHVSPYNVEINNTTQCRAITRNPQRIKELTADIGRNGVRAPLLVRRNRTGNGYSLLNGTHRLEGTLGAIEDGAWDTSFKMPAVIIPVEIYGTVEAAIPIIQVMLNEDRHKKIGNSESDYNKFIKNYIEENKIDLTDAHQYDTTVNVMRLLIQCKSMSTIKGYITKAKNKQLLSRSDVEEKAAGDWSKDAIKVHKLRDAGKVDGKYVHRGSIHGNKFDGHVSFTSLHGSTDDQRYWRDQRWKTANPHRDLCLIVGAQRTDGSPEKVLNERKKFFEERFYRYKYLGDKGLQADIYVIAPQIKQDAALTFDGRQVAVLGEHLNVPSSWKFISRADIIKAFKQGQPFLNSWIFTEKK